MRRDTKSKAASTGKPAKPRGKIDKSERVRESGDRMIEVHRDTFEKLAESPGDSTDAQNPKQKGRRESLEEHVTEIMDEYDDVLRKLADS